jgi:DNA-binding response OmpR family regulator
MANILVVDDEPDIVRFVVKILSDRGHNVTTAVAGPQALQSALDTPPDAIVLDLNLPEMDGLEVCRRLKQTEATRSVPVVMMTGAPLSVEEARHATDTGADEYVMKPFLREVLVHNVERLLDRPR